MSQVKTFVIETPEQQSRLCQFVAARPLPFMTEIGPIRKQRTLGQNNRLWKLHELVANETGNTVEDMHEEALCRHFGFSEVRMPTGWIKRVPLKRSSARETAEFAKFMESTEAWYATEFGAWLGKDE